MLDPPKFAPTAAHAERAARACEDINWVAFLLLRPGGLRFSFARSAGIGAELFRQIVAASADYPIGSYFPERDYRKVGAGETQG